MTQPTVPCATPAAAAISLYGRAASSQLMDDGPKRRRAQAALHLGEVAQSTPAEPETDHRVCAMVTVPRVRPQNPELQAERLHCLDRVGKKTLLRVLTF